MQNECECPRRRVSGFTLVQHCEPCPNAPVGPCGGCGHDVVPGEDTEHELCAAA
jgi:hypothetical protein